MTIKLITERTRGLFLGARGISGIPGGRQWRLMGRRPPLAFHRETTKTRPTSSFFHINLYLFIYYYYFFLRILRRHRLTVYTLKHCR